MKGEREASARTRSRPSSDSVSSKSPPPASSRRWRRAAASAGGVGRRRASSAGENLTASTATARGTPANPPIRRNSSVTCCDVPPGVASAMVSNLQGASATGVTSISSCHSRTSASSGVSPVLDLAARQLPEARPRAAGRPARQEESPFADEDARDDEARAGRPLVCSSARLAPQRGGRVPGETLGRGAPDRGTEEARAKGLRPRARGSRRDRGTPRGRRARRRGASLNGQTSWQSSQPKRRPPRAASSAAVKGVRFSIVRYERHFRASRTRGATKARVGQASRHAVHEPQRSAPGSAGAAVGASATSVRISPRTTCEPRPGTIRRPFFPMNPRPARAASSRSRRGAVSTQTRKWEPRRRERPDVLDDRLQVPADDAVVVLSARVLRHVPGAAARDRARDGEDRPREREDRVESHAGRGIALEIRHFPVEPLLEPRAVALERDRPGGREDAGGREAARARRRDRGPGEARGVVRERAGEAGAGTREATGRMTLQSSNPFRIILDVPCRAAPRRTPVRARLPAAARARDGRSLFRRSPAVPDGDRLGRDPRGRPLAALVAREEALPAAHDARGGALHGVGGTRRSSSGRPPRNGDRESGVDRGEEPRAKSCAPGISGRWRTCGRRRSRERRSRGPRIEPVSRPTRFRRGSPSSRRARRRCSRPRAAMSRSRFSTRS